MKRIAVLTLNLLLLFGLLLQAVPANAFAYPYRANNLPIGDYKTATEYRKQIEGPAGVDPETHTPTGVRVRYNMRKPNGTLAGNDVFKTSFTNIFYITYIDGEGVLGRKYGLTARNTVGNADTVTIAGTWRP